MPTVKSVSEKQSITIIVVEDGVEYEACFSFPSDDVKKAQLSIMLKGGAGLSIFPAVVAQSAIQTFAETKVEFAS